MEADESCAVVRLPGGERTLAFWMIDRQPIWIEVAVYVGLGFLWALPFRKVFRGVGQADPDAPGHD